MKLYAPNYYKSFHCIADKCRHSCCIGWEIDIDDDSLARFEVTDGDFGKRLKSKIVKENNIAYFRLGEGDRCPFLNRQGLCDMILTLGENSLCEICREHPRFYNYISDRQEIGLGLCCEEAARIILTQKEKTEIILLFDDGETETAVEEEKTLLTLRKKLFDILQMKAIPLSRRIKEMLATVGASDIPQQDLSHWIKILRSLERMDSAWDNLLDQAEMPVLPIKTSENQKPYEKLLLYFLYRHLPDTTDQDDLKARVRFALLAFYIIRAIVQGGKMPLEEVARRYSSEVEYSTDNTETLLHLLTDDTLDSQS